MTKRTLGSVVKEARDGARMSQRELGAAVGIKASHVAYVENGRRRPSIALINRLSEMLGLNGKELLVLAHPEVKQIVDGDQPSAKKSDGSWQRFVSNQALLRRHAITKGRTQGSEAGCVVRNRRPSRPFHFHSECNQAGRGPTLTILPRFSVRLAHDNRAEKRNRDASTIHRAGLSNDAKRHAFERPGFPGCAFQTK